MKIIKNNFRMLKLMILILSMVFIPVLKSYAEQNIALNYFQKAEAAFQANQLVKALALYNKALEEYSVDGDLIIERTINRKIISQGRTSKKVENIQVKKASYFPNRRIHEVQTRIDDQYRASHPPVLQLNWISLQEPTDDNILDGGETGTIAVEIKNNGESSAKEIKLHLQSLATAGVRFNNSEVIPQLDPGQSIITVINVDVSKHVPDMLQRLIAQAKENNGYQSNELEIVLPSKPHQPDEIVIAKMSIEDLNGDGLIEPTEMVMVKATVVNAGRGVSNDLIASLQFGENIYPAPDSLETIQLGKIYPGGAKNIQFSFLTNHKFSHNQPLPVSLNIVDQENKNILLSDLGLSINIPNNKIIVNVLARNQKKVSNTSNLVDVDMLIPEGNRKNKNAIAVVIGNRNYRKRGLPRVEYAHNDSRVMKDYLIKTMGYDESNIFYYEDATSANFTELFGSKENHKGRVFNHIKPNVSEVFIYYSGHGAPDIKSRNSFFVPVDADPNYISLSGYSLDLFYKNMAKNHAKQIIVVLDTCFSGNSDGGYLLGNISPAMVNINDPDPQLKNAAIFSSTRSDQVSVWFHDKKHSLFTYYFLKGLTGEADNNKDSAITSAELGNYVKDYVPYQARRLNGLEQDPSLIQHQDIELVKFGDVQTHIIKTVNSF